jgi:hypothetical protein
MTSRRRAAARTAAWFSGLLGLVLLYRAGESYAPDLMGILALLALPVLLVIQYRSNRKGDGGEETVGRRKYRDAPERQVAAMACNGRLVVQDVNFYLRTVRLEEGHIVFEAEGVIWKKEGLLIGPAEPVKIYGPDGVQVHYGILSKGLEGVRVEKGLTMTFCYKILLGQEFL